MRTEGVNTVSAREKILSVSLSMILIACYYLFIFDIGKCSITGQCSVKVNEGAWGVIGSI